MREHWDECPSVFDLGWDLSPRPSLKGRGLVRLQNEVLSAAEVGLRVGLASPL